MENVYHTGHQHFPFPSSGPASFLDNVHVRKINISVEAAGGGGDQKSMLNAGIREEFC